MTGKVVVDETGGGTGTSTEWLLVGTCTFSSSCCRTGMLAWRVGTGAARTPYDALSACIASLLEDEDDALPQRIAAARTDEKDGEAGASLSAASEAAAPGTEGADGPLIGAGREPAGLSGAADKPGRATPRVWRLSGTASSSSLALGDECEGSLTPIGAPLQAGLV